ncbi:MAG: two-component system, OmpR family, phosphate regulon sensor histidine kinase PhoR [Campylobacterota bacterium]|nr:two-component system, OmpR family, phosphate regulon sensor histidine kinase PhoR [Campylobacterota bacterium]
MSILIFVVFTIGLFLLGRDVQTIIFAIILLALAFSFFVFSIYRGAKHMEKELNTINKYLENIDKIDKIDYKAHFFTQEFEELNQNLAKALKKAQKREEIKQQYNAKLKLKNRQRADMISAIAHEFRNPVASIMGYAQTLQDDPNIPKPLQEKFLSKIYNNGNKIESLLARLILWNKFESKETNLHKSKFDILELAQEIKFSLQDKYKNREIVVQGKSRIVEADRTLMDVALKNLIENALKYSKDEVTIAIDAQRISVADKGVGIAPKDIDKVTKKFYRSGVHNWDNSMGLGLSIVKTILMLHHTKLEIESELGKGSIFSFVMT